MEDALLHQIERAFGSRSICQVFPMRRPRHVQIATNCKDICRSPDDITYNLGLMSKFSARTASASFFLKSCSASTHTLCVRRCGNTSNVGKRSALNCSDASRGNSVGRWSIETTDRGGLPALIEGSELLLPSNTEKTYPTLTGTVGASNVVLTL